jgi:phospholipid/cholesterol/gamma-HCH transport system substrate-binding protein
MQSRAVREGSVGLMLLAGLGVFGGIFLWLKGLTPGNQSYNIIAQFPQAPGIQPGGVVRFRGIRVGKILKIEPGVNGVDVVMQMDDPNLTIPKDVIIAVSQTGLIGEPVVEITPRSAMTIDPSKIAKALDTNCDRNLILCNNTKVNGEMGANFNQLLERATKLIDLYTNPELVKNLNNTLVKTGTAAEDFSRLSKSLDRLSGEFSSLPKSVEKGLNNLTVNANTITSSLDRTSSKIGKTADKLGRTTDEFNLTAVEYKKLAISVNSLVAENRKTFTSSLNNFDRLTVDLRRTTNSLTPTINKLNSTVAKVNSDKLVKDLQDLLSNANQTAINLKSVSASLNDPKTLLILQQTLDSARITFQNTQKITADVDEITGSPEFRANFRNLVNGLGKLVSQGEQLEQQVKLAQTIEPLGKSLNNPVQLSNPTRYSFRRITPRDLSTFPTENQFKPDPQILDPDSPVPFAERLPERIVPPNGSVGGKTPVVPAAATSKQPLSKGKLLPIRRQQKTPPPSPQTQP